MPESRLYPKIYLEMYATDKEYCGKQFVEKISDLGLQNLFKN